MKRVAITGATGQIAYSFIFRLAHGDVFGIQEPLEISLCDIPGTEVLMEALALELEDCAFPLLKNVRWGTSPFEMFEGVEYALLIGSLPRTKGMERRDLLRINGNIFVDQGKALNESAARSVCVVVVGNPCNTNCLIAMHHAPDISRKNFHAMMRLDQNRAQALLAQKANVAIQDIKCVSVWGNHSPTQVPDFTNALIKKMPVRSVIQDNAWLQDEFMEMVRQRGKLVLERRGKSSAASAANALIQALISLHVPTPMDDWFSSAVCTDNNSYGIEDNLIFGFPCRSYGEGKYFVIEQLMHDFFIKEQIAISQQELIAERDCVRDLLS